MGKAAAKEDNNKDDQSLIEIESLPPIRQKQPLSVPMVAQLLVKNYKAPDIAAAFGISKQAVYQFIDRNKAKLAILKTFKDNKADILEELQYDIVSSVDSADLKKMQPYQKITAIGILEDKVQVIRGESSSKNQLSVVLNIACQSHDKVIDIKVDKSVNNSVDNT